MTKKVTINFVKHYFKPGNVKVGKNVMEENWNQNKI